jgi:quinol-cytochrome oxidoreductase complex cytochrome b subunit
MFRVSLTGGYKPPREFNWNIGVLLLLFTMLAVGHRLPLPDDQLGFSAVAVGTDMARATPVLGSEGPFGPPSGVTAFNDVRFALLGGLDRRRERPVARVHLALRGDPSIASVLMIVHFWRIRRAARSRAPRPS